MKYKKDLSGERFGRLLAQYPTQQRYSGSVVWHCVCDCGGTKDVSRASLVSGRVKSCGCLAKERSQKNVQIMNQKKRKDLTGQKSGTWTALKRLNEQAKSGNFYWLCQCENGHFSKIHTGNWGKIKTCRQCKNSYSFGELVVQEILQKMQINFKEEYQFQDCVYQAPLRFDFYLPDYNCCIEYDGIQHFKKTNFSHDNFETRQKRDQIKNQYCQNNNIVLIRIPYTDLDLVDEQYILDKLNNNGIILNS